MRRYQKIGKERKGIDSWIPATAASKRTSYRNPSGMMREKKFCAKRLMIRVSCPNPSVITFAILFLLLFIRNLLETEKPKEGKETAQQKNPLEEKERKEKTKLWEFKRKGIIIGILREGKKRCWTEGRTLTRESNSEFTPRVSKLLDIKSLFILCWDKFSGIQFFGGFIIEIKVNLLFEAISNHKITAFNFMVNHYWNSRNQEN